jgi:hypothetical protein
MQVTKQTCSTYKGSGKNPVPQPFGVRLWKKKKMLKIICPKRGVLVLWFPCPPEKTKKDISCFTLSLQRLGSLCHPLVQKRL